SRGFVNQNFQPKWLKMDIVGDVSKIKNRGNAFELERSLYGLAMPRKLKLAFLPEELIASSIIDSQQVLRTDYLADYLSESGNQYGGVSPSILVIEAETEFFRFKTISQFTDGSITKALYRGHQEIGNYAIEDLLTAAVAGGDYLANNVYADGSFAYSYFPKTDVYSRDYNILRHAGTIFSLLQLYEVTEDPALLATAENAIGYLLHAIDICPHEVQPVGCVVEDGEIKLGGNGLALLALAKYIEITGERQTLGVMTLLAAWIEGSQNSDGEFAIHKESFPERSPIDFISQYYPGEAIFGLTQLYALDGNSKWIDMAEAAVDWLIDVRDFGISDDDLPHDHWLLYGIYELYQIRPKPEHLAHAFRISNAIMDSQNLSPEYPDWYGTYYIPPRSTPTATRSEAFCSAYKLAQQIGDLDQSKRILTAYEDNVGFQLITQFQPETLMYLSNPQAAMGGFHTELTNYEIRIDYVQHNISSLLCLYEILSE
ncbi:MAG: hypothetical protein N2D54_01225, partial [Chloroflexota bacterium]